MRFREFKAFLREAKENIVVIGDSIATGIAGAGGVSKEYTNPGKNTQFVANNLVSAFVKSGDAKGAVVILSSGAANSSKVTTVDGKPIQSEMFGPIANQIKMLTDAGASVALVGVASRKTPPQKPTQYTAGQQWTIDYTGVNEKLEAIASSAGATFLGPLEEFDPGIAKGDGIHPFNGYTKLFQAGSKVKAKTLAPKAGQGGTTTPADKPGSSPQDVLTSLSVPRGRIGPDVADIQKVLLALGYSLPQHGVDGVRGKETSSAVKMFQKDNGLEPDGDPGVETVSKLNAMLKSNPKIAGKITRSKETDVKASMHGNEKLEPAAYNSVTTGKIGKLLDLISKPESGGHYDIMMGGKRNPKILSMTLAELLQYQREYKAAGAETAAAGRYQFMPNTLRDVGRSLGLNFNSDTFDPKTQDDLAIHLLRQKGLDSWLSGKMSDDAFMDRLSQVWAGLPSPSKGGASWYQGVGSNKAGVSVASVQSTLNDIKTA